MNPQKKKCVHDFLRTLLPALTQAHQYTISHRLTSSSIDTAYDHLLLALGSERTLSLIMIDERIVVDKEPLDDSLYSGRFIQFFKSRGIEYLGISQGITKEEVRSFIEALTTASSLFTDNAVFEHIKFGTVGLSYKSDDKGEPATSGGISPEPDVKETRETLAAARHFESICKREFNLMADVYAAAGNDRRLPDNEIKQVVTDIIKTIRHESSLMLTFSPLRILDEYTFTHSTNVCILAIAQAMALKMKDEDIYDVGVAAMLHDIGKVSIPDEILNKQGSLTDEERDIIRQHPLRGVEYLVDKPGIPPLAIVVAYEHHMLYDYSGYPQVPVDRRQNICSQITTIADYFDALRTKRPYRGPVETKAIADDMAAMSGRALHPVLTKNFLILVKKLFPETEL